MKKILFLQIKSNSIGGVWFVNKTLGHKFIELGYDVQLLAIRRCPGKDLVNEKLIKTTTINNNDKWEIVHFYNIKKKIKEKKFFESFILFLIFIKDKFFLKADFIKAKKFIKDYNPDYIISTHYQLLDVVPKKLLNRTIHEQHTSYRITYEDKSTMNKFNKYKNKIRFVWLTKATCNLAVLSNFTNSKYIYNPVSIKTNKIANVVKNKKIITIARIEYSKKIDEMISIVDEIFDDEKYFDWSFDIYGPCNDINLYLKCIKNKDKIKYMGTTNNVLDKYLTSSINLNTSIYEGLPMSILEANECGVPTISYNFGESVYETIINEKTGYIIENRDKNAYIKKLKYLMDNNNVLLKMSSECKQYNETFEINSIMDNWIDLFKEIDGD